MNFYIVKKRAQNKINALFFAGIIAFSLCTSPIVKAHHSFAIYDFTIQTEFSGTVDTLNFRNPHITMLLKAVDANGNESIIDFIEGAPANMYVRNGLRPAMIKVGTQITVIGSPLRKDPTKFFIQKIILEDGSEF